MRKHSSKPVGVLIAVMIAITIQCSNANAAWGDFDTSFGFQGAVFEPDAGYRPAQVLVTADGKVLVSGTRTTPTGQFLFLRRYLSNGAADLSFGSGGVATGPSTNSWGSEFQRHSIVVLPNGKIALSARVNGYHAIWQLIATGKNDRTFGTNGLVSFTQYQTDSRFPELVVQNGKLLIGFRKLEVADKPVTLIRINANGTIDQTFGNAGEAITTIKGEPSASTESGIVVEADGKITVSGNKTIATFGLDRLLANGKPDRSFAPVDSSEFGTAALPGLIKYGAGKYVFLTQNSGLTFNIQKFSASGVFESALYLDLYPYAPCPRILATQSDGKVVVGPGNRLFRFNSAIVYGSAEILECQYLQGFEGIAVLQPDNKIVAAGVYNNLMTIVRLSAN